MATMIQLTCTGPNDIPIVVNMDRVIYMSMNSPANPDAGTALHFSNSDTHQDYVIVKETLEQIAKHPAWIKQNRRYVDSGKPRKGTKMNIERLNKLADVLESEKAQEHFDMTTFLSKDGRISVLFGQEIGESIQSCNTVACIAGWAVATFAPDTVFGEGISIQSRAEDLLDMTEKEGQNLFLMYNTSIHLEQIEPRHAAMVLRNYAETGNINWEITGLEALYIEEDQSLDTCWELGHPTRCGMWFPLLPLDLGGAA